MLRKVVRVISSCLVKHSLMKAKMNTMPLLRERSKYLERWLFHLFRAIHLYPEIHRLFTRIFQID